MVDEIREIDFNHIHKTQAVFMGRIVKQHGVQYFLQAIPAIIKKVPNFKLLLIGEGNYLSELKRITSKLAIEQYVHFVGHVDRYEDMLEMGAFKDCL